MAEHNSQRSALPNTCDGTSLPRVAVAAGSDMPADADQAEPEIAEAENPAVSDHRHEAALTSRDGE